jgi:hypothetical protein
MAEKWQKFVLRRRSFILQGVDKNLDIDYIAYSWLYMQFFKKGMP